MRVTQTREGRHSMALVGHHFIWWCSFWIARFESGKRFHYNLLDFICGLVTKRAKKILNQTKCYDFLETFMMPLTLKVALY